VATAADPVHITTPQCTPGIGKVILKPDSDGVIDGVRIHPFPLWPDDRGYFLEVIRIGQGPGADFDPKTTQVSAALSYPGTIKAFHYHKYQTDLWVPSAGMFQVALVDLRESSPTFGVKNTMYLGALRTWQILIPPGVGHGYKVIGESPAMLVYVTSRIYDPADEGRIAYNDPAIQYDWELQHK
jgi:dTDP-4-dehydrorhamnose 3,5-epimerase